MVIYIEDIDIESIKEVTAKIHEAKGEHIDFYVCSNGGEVTGADFLSKIINNLDKATIYIDMLGSCALPFVKSLNHRKILLEGGYGIYHCQAWKTSMSTKNSGRGSFEQFKLSTLPEKIDPVEWLNEEENKIYCNGYDVYLNSKRLKEILNIE